MYSKKQKKSGFTLIELSIVLVIIGLIAGGVLVGRDLIHAAEIRAQVSQIEKYNAATNTFKVKYNALPGDIAEPNATAFGFVARGSNKGEGDGDGAITGSGDLYGVSDWNMNGAYYASVQGGGETNLFWNDLAKAGLIEGKYIGDNTLNSYNLNELFPSSKLGNGHVIVWSGGFTGNSGGTNNRDRYNYFNVLKMNRIDWPASNITPSQAYSIDSKIDDGLPQSGNIQDLVINIFGLVYYANGEGAWFTAVSDTSATPASDTSCFDNGGNAGTTQKYSVGTNGGNGLNCALSFRFQ